MSSVRVLVGTRKGAFILSADGKRANWKISGPHFAGWEIYHLKGSAADPNRLYASQSSSWFGQTIHRSDDGGRTWETAGNEFPYDGAKTWQELPGLRCHPSGPSWMPGAGGMCLHTIVPDPSRSQRMFVAISA